LHGNSHISEPERANAIESCGMVVHITMDRRSRKVARRPYSFAYLPPQAYMPRTAGGLYPEKGWKFRVKAPSPNVWEALTRGRTPRPMGMNPN